MRVKLHCIVEVEVNPARARSSAGGRQHPINLDDLAQEQLDAFREAVLPNQYGVSIYRDEVAPAALAVLREFVEDGKVVSVGYMEDDWPDLLVTYEKAVEVLAKCERLVTAVRKVGSRG